MTVSASIEADTPAKWPVHPLHPPPPEMRPSSLFSILLFATTAACSSTASTPSSSTSTTAPSGAVTMEIFSGTVTVTGRDFHPFNEVVSGQVNVVLTAVGPPSTIYMGLGVGTYDGTTCTLLTGGTVVTGAGTTAQLAGAAAAGTYCVEVYDVGNQTAPVAYSVTVNHY
jgi:hypothetical protein